MHDVETHQLWDIVTDLQENMKTIQQESKEFQNQITIMQQKNAGVKAEMKEIKQ